MSGRGNQAVLDAGWPEGALAMANFESRIGWWEGPPFGGGESHFLFCGNTEGFKDPLTIYDVPATNVILQLASAGSIHVAVADQKGKPLSRYEGHEILVQVEPRGGSKVGSWGGSAKVKDDGTFEFNNVPPGDYRITSRPNPSNSNRQYAPEQMVTVTPGGHINVTVVYE